MSSSLADAISALRRAGVTIAETAIHVDRCDPGVTRFGGGQPGHLGELGRALYAQWLRAVEARLNEADAHGARLHDAADDLARAADGYTETDHQARQRHPAVG